MIKQNMEQKNIEVYNRGMDLIYNKTTKRYNTLKTAKANGLLTNPNNFRINENYMVVKNKAGNYILTNKEKGKKFVNDFDDEILKINQHLIFKHGTKNIVKKTEKNIKENEVFRHERSELDAKYQDLVNNYNDLEEELEDTKA